MTQMLQMKANHDTEMAQLKDNHEKFKTEVTQMTLKFHMEMTQSCKTMARKIHCFAMETTALAVHYISNLEQLSSRKDLAEKTIIAVQVPVRLFMKDEAQNLAEQDMMQKAQHQKRMVLGEKHQKTA